MKDDDILRGIRDHVRAERADDAALEALARGETGTARIEELERRAAADPETAAVVAASRPFGPAIEEKIAAHVGLAPAPAKAPAPAPAAAPANERRVLPFLRRAAIYAGPVALAAAVLLYVGLGGIGGERHAALPDYAVSASSEKEMRGPGEAGEATASLQLRGGPDAQFEIVARPSTTAAAKVVAYVFAMGEGEPNPVDAQLDVAPEGSVRIRGKARALEGAKEIRVVLGTANDSIKRFEDALSRARDGKSDADVRVLVIPIVRR